MDVAVAFALEVFRPDLADLWVPNKRHARVVEVGVTSSGLVTTDLNFPTTLTPAIAGGMVSRKAYLQSQSDGSGADTVQLLARGWYPAGW